MPQTKLYEFQPPADSYLAKKYPDIAKKLVCIGEGIIENGTFTGKMRDKRLSEFDNLVIKLSAGDCAWDYAVSSSSGYSTVGVFALPIANVKELGPAQDQEVTGTQTLDPEAVKEIKEHIESKGISVSTEQVETFIAQSMQATAERTQYIEQLRGKPTEPGMPPTYEQMLAKELDRRPDIKLDTIKEQVDAGNIYQYMCQLRKERLANKTQTATQSQSR
jgi:hypothetical protein